MRLHPVTWILTAILLTAPASADTLKLEDKQSLGAAFAAVRHQVKVDDNGVLRANNPAGGIKAEFRNDAVWLTQADAGRFALELKTVGRGKNAMRAAEAKPVAHENRVEYRRSANVVEWWNNTTAGLEQGFTLTKRPAGKSDLEVVLNLRGELRAEAASGTALRLLRDNKEVLRYAGLKSWDADGHVVPSHMDAEGQNIRLVIDDSRAHYPITIDPTIQATLLTPSSDPTAFSYGNAVAISGNTAVVTSDQEDGVNGAIYVFVRTGTTWSMQARIATSPYEFPDRIALDGNTIIAGAPETPSVNVYVRNGTTWTKQASLVVPGLDGYSLFGWSVGISGDTAIVGTFNTATQATFIFVRTGTAWALQASLYPDDPNYYGCGWYVAVSGNTALVACPVEPNNPQYGSVYVFVRNGSTWTKQTKLTEALQPSSVAISGDTAVVGSQYDLVDNVNTGAAYVYVRNGGTWTLQQKLTAPDLAQANIIARLGSSVAIDGDLVAAGAVRVPNANSLTAQGQVYTFLRNGTSWKQLAKIYPDPSLYAPLFGGTVGVSGDTVAISGNWDLYNYQASNGTAFVANVSRTVPVTIASSPAGRGFSVSGNGCEAGSYSASKTLNWTVGSNCTVTFSSPQGGNLGAQYVFTRWSDGNTSASRSFVTPDAATTFTAEFKTQYLLSTTVSPAGSGSVTGAGYYDAGSTAAVVASANAGFAFTNWSGAVAAPLSTSTTVTMTAPQSVTANFQQLTSTTVAAVAGQYSDSVTLSATVTPAGGVFSGSLQFQVAGVNVGSAIPISGGGTYTLPYTISQAAGSYSVSAVMTSGTPVASNSSGSNTLTVSREDATITPSSTNATTVAVSTAGGTAGPITLTATLAQAADGSLGNMALAGATVTLNPAINGASDITCPATIAGTTITATCASVPVNAYTVIWQVTGNYFTAPTVNTVLAVYDPSLGFVTGAGKLTNNGVQADFALSVRYQKNGTLTGGLTYVEHRASGDVKVESTAMTSLSLVDPTAVVLGQATINGTTAASIQLIVADNGEPGAGKDQFGLQVTGGNLTPAIFFAPVTITSGNIQNH